ncbi:MAG TPA: hypothetical protein VM389_05520 [Phycisphaerae bacterium]|nr:hypothetical protein [Phycisphaerae bacterium]HUU59200.1 hypothetical protein [Phycisphaerae bacterium]
MKAAAERVKGNTEGEGEKETLVRELEEVSIQKKQLEKREKWLKSKLEPLFAPGERVGLVELVVSRPLDVDDELLAELEKRLGPSVVKRSVNTKFLRAVMDGDQELDREIPRKEQRSLRVGEAFKG